MSVVYRTHYHLGKTYIINDEDGLETDLQIGAVIRSDEFDKKFYYDGNDLGANYTKEKQSGKSGLLQQPL